MHDFSCNFKPAATIPDTSCIYPGDDCDDNDPETVNDQVTEDCGCEGEIPADGIDALAQWGIEMHLLRLSKMCCASNSVGGLWRDGLHRRPECQAKPSAPAPSKATHGRRQRPRQRRVHRHLRGTWGKATRRVMVTSGR